MLYSAYGDETGVQCALGCVDQTRVSAVLHGCVGLCCVMGFSVCVLQSAGVCQGLWEFDQEACG